MYKVSNTRKENRGTRISGVKIVLKYFFFHPQLKEKNTTAAVSVHVTSLFFRFAGSFSHIPFFLFSFYKVFSSLILPTTTVITAYVRSIILLDLSSSLSFFTRFLHKVSLQRLNSFRSATRCFYFTFQCSEAWKWYVCAWICVLMCIHNKKHSYAHRAFIRCIKTTLGLTIVVSQLAWSHRQHFSVHRLSRRPRLMFLARFSIYNIIYHNTHSHRETSQENQLMFTASQICILCLYTRIFTYMPGGIKIHVS